ncbi:hypothetical protein DQ353_12565 [Arthrobacter sp. AQ5-05]|uniref:hypothetical protein n=1 Tax=Arthrobacter sp. AQ5-05 TaxID=2184581 RepID=UPI000DCEFE0E|nr:hypothetical protein [Arthrobacter sp. AQ5-05]RAX48946.1 hypothetical protein DQ353_12565 [Arthrobacter sp. AQ5-05]
MTTEEIMLWIQAAAVVVAVGASIVALTVSALDRRNARAIAARDREVAVRQAKLMFEMEALLRLAQIRRRGGHVDKDISKDMGAEAGALVGALGADRIPRNWAGAVDRDEAGLLEFISDESKEGWQRDSVEVQVALNAVTAELRDLMEAQGKA